MTTIRQPTKSAARRLPLHLRIVWARKRKGISQEGLARMIGTSRRHMIRIEKGQHTPGLVLRERIAEATEQTVEFFATDDEEDSPLSRDLLDAVAVFVRELAKAST